MKVLCIGEILIDFTPRLDIANSYVANPGGAPANVAVSVQRCGGHNRCRRLLLGRLFMPAS